MPEKSLIPPLEYPGYPEPYAGQLSMLRTFGAQALEEESFRSYHTRYRRHPQDTPEPEKAYEFMIKGHEGRLLRLQLDQSGPEDFIALCDLLRPWVASASTEGLKRTEQDYTMGVGRTTVCLVENALRLSQSHPDTEPALLDAIATAVAPSDHPSVNEFSHIAQRRLDTMLREYSSTKWIKNQDSFKNTVTRGREVSQLAIQNPAHMLRLLSGLTDRGAISPESWYLGLKVSGVNHPSLDFLTTAYERILEGKPIYTESKDRRQWEGVLSQLALAALKHTQGQEDRRQDVVRALFDWLHTKGVNATHRWYVSFGDFIKLGNIITVKLNQNPETTAELGYLGQLPATIDSLAMAMGRILYATRTPDATGPALERQKWEDEIKTGLIDTALSELLGLEETVPRTLGDLIAMFPSASPEELKQYLAQHGSRGHLARVRRTGFISERHPISRKPFMPGGIIS